MDNLKIFNFKKTKTIIYQGDEAIKKINEMGLSYHILSFPFLHALAVKKSIPKYAMGMHKNFALLFNSVLKFREMLLQDGWTYKESKNFNQTIAPSGRFMITISSGDEYVGNPYYVSRTKNRKGKVAENVIELNNIVQLNLNIPEFHKYKLKYNPKLALNWFLLFHVKKDRIKIELSLPRQLDAKTKKVIDWHERIILPDIILDNNDENNPPTYITPNNGVEFQPLCDNSIDDIDITKK